MNPKVDFFFDKPSKWQEEFRQLRILVLEIGLAEELKWGVPCYTHHGNNVVLIHGFKEYCALLFHKGALLSDADGILIQQTQNVQAARQIRFGNVQEIISLKSVVRAYIQEAIEVDKAGLKVELKKTKEFEIPKEFKVKLDESPVLKNAFEALTPGRQRAYFLYFGSAKQTKTREARVDKLIPKILAGQGLND